MTQDILKKKTCTAKKLQISRFGHFDGSSRYLDRINCAKMSTSSLSVHKFLEAFWSVKERDADEDHG
jgi:hypothetical protein